MSLIARYVAHSVTVDGTLGGNVTRNVRRTLEGNASSYLSLLSYSIIFYDVVT